MVQTIRKLKDAKYFPILVLLIAGLTAGFFSADDYGRSLDEASIEEYARYTIEVYQGYDWFLDSDSVMHRYGPAYHVLTEIGAGFLTDFLPWHVVDARHFIHYLAFLAATFFVYDLSLRFSDKFTAFVVSALFYLQPLLFGHAFINPKDPVFMAFFTGTFSLGLHAVDLIASRLSDTDLRSVTFLNNIFTTSAVLQRWKDFPVWRKAVILTTALAALILALDLLLFGGIQTAAERTLNAAYNGQSGPFISSLFERAAEDAWKTPLQAYTSKLSFLFQWLRYLSLGTAVLMAFFLFGKAALIRGNQAAWILILAAAATAGLGVSTRVFGFFSAGLVSLYALLSLKRRSPHFLLLYWIISAAVMFATWPYLWRAPFQHLQETIREMSSYPWYGEILYRGRIHQFPDNSVPWHYVPWLITVQLTLPAVLSGSAGLLYSFRHPAALINKHWDRSLLLLWFILPLASSWIPSANLYDNFRQLLFILPPLFILGALPLQAVFGRLRPGWKGVLAMSMLIPGVIGILKLHPYEYIHYNTLVGGLSGAQGAYEMDYWFTSSREAVEYLNNSAPKGAVVGYYNHHLGQIKPFVREDIQLVTTGINGRITSVEPDFAVICFRGKHYLDIDPVTEVVWTVELENVPLAMVLEY